MDKQREKKLSDKEKENIINIILKYKNIIENKQTDSVNLKQKRETWEKICYEFNSDSVHKRSVQQLKVFYKNAKSDLKKEIALNKTEISKTGGGTSAFVFNENNPLLSIVTEQSTPLRNEYDSSKDIFEHVQDFEIESLCENNRAGNLEEVIINEPETDDSNSVSVVSTNRGRQKKNARREQLQKVKEFCDEIAALKKAKLECEIEKNKMKIEVYKKKLEILNKIDDNQH